MLQCHVAPLYIKLLVVYKTAGNHGEVFEHSDLVNSVKLAKVKKKSLACTLTVAFRLPNLNFTTTN